MLGIDPAQQPVLAVVPADQRVDWQRVSAVVGRTVDLASLEQAARWGGLDNPAGLPPFGVLFDCAAVVDPALAGFDTIAFAAGTVTDAILMSWEAYAAVAQPTLATITSGAKS